ncbi:MULTISPECIES: FHA domain-containing protein [Treponema]|uniref:PSer/pThr/pTyr-binding forkhead associated (FHA) protein n=1 Tax=Treponema rectale TaxID=744512 RepID=A0A840SDA5_9SPIR|nr:MULTISPECIES: FHA domain-containing protein [Treponema]MBB5219757.1 pSer/pThr/pTyr-binding forkhead associated (FHA) protein [Treponema rectale]MBE6354379.1 FHA domain-containing protein [Treponema sp.]MBO6177182.1 FHA domain-containing protein [Treponema sp.]
MADTTVVNASPLGQHLERIAESQQVSYLVFNKKRITLVAKITIGRETDNTIVIDNKLASRHHCMIQKIRDAYFLKDENSTNGTFLNGRRIPPDKYVRLNPGDKITVGSSNLIMG